MKEQRQKAILKLIQEEDLEVQEELLERLHKLGFACTQATISRDIKELHLVKERTSSGTCKYVVSLHRGRTDLANRLQTIFRESVTSFDESDCAEDHARFGQCGGGGPGRNGYPQHGGFHCRG